MQVVSCCTDCSFDKESNVRLAQPVVYECSVVGQWVFITLNAIFLDCICFFFFFFPNTVLFRKYHITIGDSFTLFCIQMLAFYLQMDIRKLVNKIRNQVIANELSECSRYNGLQGQEYLLQLQV